jgi:hypothetical protein
MRACRPSLALSLLIAVPSLTYLLPLYGRIKYAGPATVWELAAGYLDYMQSLYLLASLPPPYLSLMLLCRAGAWRLYLHAAAVYAPLAMSMTFHWACPLSYPWGAVCGLSAAARYAAVALTAALTAALGLPAARCEPGAAARIAYYTAAAVAMALSALLIAGAVECALWVLL